MEYTETEILISKMINRLAELDGWQPRTDPTDWLDILNTEKKPNARIFKWYCQAKALYHVIQDTF